MVYVLVHLGLLSTETISMFLNTRRNPLSTEPVPENNTNARMFVNQSILNSKKTKQQLYNKKQPVLRTTTIFIAFQTFHSLTSTPIPPFGRVQRVNTVLGQFGSFLVSHRDLVSVA